MKKTMSKSTKIDNNIHDIDYSNNVYPFKRVTRSSNVAMRDNNNDNKKNNNDNDNRKNNINDDNDNINSSTTKDNNTSNTNNDKSDHFNNNKKKLQKSFVSILFSLPWVVIINCIGLMGFRDGSFIYFIS